MSDSLSPRRAAFVSAPRFTRFLVLGLILFILIQIGMVIRVNALPPEVVARVSLPLGWDAVMQAGWALALGWRLWGIDAHNWAARRRAALLLIGYGMYTVGRLVIFAQADYDRARLPFVGVSVMVLSLLLAAYLYGVRR